ncbi:hypothetical protein [Lactiplantibacillus plantarum]|uniref:hypothetical protein n=1 Tax=Lactiplantibacillus plantarum TaxID=1590 RepID=UPI0021A6C880|nr:hypothetical protein [Lactiplantibacillus plantarum]MCT3231905.1 hypothetical protein [Lactiplantibacillus plantarum]MCT3549796.1 hypothetical protein [Lactiplantibacillus plantarum]
MSKAYEVSFDDYDGVFRTLVFAETSGKAKYQVIGTDGFDDAEFTDLGCKRAKWADELENASQLEIEIAELKHGWSWWLEDGGESIDEDAIPLVEKYGGVDRFVAAFEDSNSNLHYGEDGFYEKDPAKENSYFM